MPHVCKTKACKTRVSPDSPTGLCFSCRVAAGLVPERRKKSPRKSGESESEANARYRKEAAAKMETHPNFWVHERNPEPVAKPLRPGTRRVMVPQFSTYSTGGATEVSVTMPAFPELRTYQPEQEQDHAVY